MGMREEKHDVGPVTLNVAVGPETGPPLVLLHGIGQRWQNYLPVLPALCFNHQVFAVDMRGAGLSGRAEGKYRIRDFAGDIERFLADRFADPIDLAGHSLGGHVALAVAGGRPDLVRALVLEDFPVCTVEGRLANRPARPIFRVWRDLMRSGIGIKEMAESLAEHDPARSMPAQRALARSLADFDPGVFDVYLDGAPFDGYDPDAMARALACPTLLIAADPTMFARLEPAEVERLCATAPDCCSITVQGAGHNVHNDDPVAYACAVIQFLQSV